jgi:hypothetical protein
MKIIIIILKLIVTIGTLAYAGINIGVGFLWFFPTGIFGSPNTIFEQIVGKAMILLSIAMVIVLMFLFKKKTRRQFILLFALSLLEYLAFVSIAGFGAEADTFFLLYVIFLLLLSFLVTMVEKELEKTK